MHSEEESDQLHLLEQKVGVLIEVTKALRQEMASLAEKLQNQKTILANLSQEHRKLKRERDKVGQRIAAVLVKIERGMGRDEV